jgi:hypothetical protein
MSLSKVTAEAVKVFNKLDSDVTFIMTDSWLKTMIDFCHYTTLLAASVLVFKVIITIIKHR